MMVKGYSPSVEVLIALVFEVGVAFPVRLTSVSVARWGKGGVIAKALGSDTPWRQQQNRCGSEQLS